MSEKAIEAVARALMHTRKCDLPAGIPVEHLQFGKVSLDDAQAAIAAHLAWLEANGFAVVPVEPTSQMLWDGEASYGDKFYFKTHHAKSCYRAMIAAAKAQPK